MLLIISASFAFCALRYNCANYSNHQYMILTPVVGKLPVSGLCIFNETITLFLFT